MQRGKAHCAPLAFLGPFHPRSSCQSTKQQAQQFPRSSLHERTSLKDGAGAEAAIRLDGRQCLCFFVRILNCTSADFLRDCVPKITPSFKAKVEGRTDWSRLMHFRARSEERCRRSGSGTGYFRITIKQALSRRINCRQRMERFPSVSSVMIAPAFHWICQSSAVWIAPLRIGTDTDPNGRAAVGLFRDTTEQNDAHLSSMQKMRL